VWSGHCFNSPVVRSLSRWVLAVFASPAGVFVLAALDSTLFFSLPFGIDAIVILMAARLDTYGWIVPLLATAGSLLGAALTFWMGVKIGDTGLHRYVPESRLARVRTRISTSGAVALAVLDLLPPPFPFTPFVLAAGALGVDARLFFVTLAVCRLFRFGLEAALAMVYGRSIVAWFESDLFHDIVVGVTFVAVVLTALSLVRLLQSLRPSGRARARARA
jgi:membrane protein YqaA with SNARE-associated domain